MSPSVARAAKTCPRCGRELEIECFAVDQSRSGGRKSACKDCDNAKSQVYYQRNRARKAAYYQARKDQAAAYYQANKAEISIGRRSRRYGLEPAQWDALLVAQQGLCYLCTEPLPAELSKIATDHDHACCASKTRRACGQCVRGLVHMACNTIVAYADDDPARLRLIADRLEARRLPGG